MTSTSIKSFLPKKAPHSSALFLVRRVADVVAGRSLSEWSLLIVNEHLTDKPDATDAPLQQERRRKLSCHLLVDLVASAYLLLGLKRDIVALLGTIRRLLVEHNTQSLLLHNARFLAHKE